MSSHLTDEQQAVVDHPLGEHARVLAVAGSGKTTTMTHRVKNLIDVHGVDPGTIGLLMFNKLAKEQFAQRLYEAGIPEAKHPTVYTFHSFAYHVMHDAERRRLRPPTRNKWFSENREEARRVVLRVIGQMERNREVRPDSIDSEEVLAAIGLWKGALIPPDRAGYVGDPAIPLIYETFEQIRTEQDALTFEDFVPTAIDLLENVRAMQVRWLRRFQYLIVDEYQDVNYSQQRLVELLAGDHADIMVVGDDDQTIYEWRGAQPYYIIQGFKTRFINKPIRDYKLSHSFRFGPLIAQCAENSIRHNEVRVSKPVIAHQHDKAADVIVIRGNPTEWREVNTQLADRIADYIDRGGDLRRLIVLGRMYSQMNGLELEFLTRKIPYRVEGGSPLLERREVVALLDYVRLANAFQDRASEQARRWLLSTANVPNRLLRRDDLSEMMTEAMRGGYTVQDALNALSDPETTPYGQDARANFDDYFHTLDLLRDYMDKPAGEVLDWLKTFIDYPAHFDNYYGNSESAEDRKRAVNSVCHYAHVTGLSLQEFLSSLANLDTTWGAPRNKQVVLTSVYRVKGLEYDIVIVPDCIEGYMPCLIEDVSPIYDTEGLVDEPPPVHNLDSERRLFYVALTRARQTAFIGSVEMPAEDAPKNAAVPSRFLDEIELDKTASVVDHLHKRDINGVCEATFAGRDVTALTRNICDAYLPTLDQGEAAQKLRWLIHAAEPITLTPEETNRIARRQRLESLLGTFSQDKLFDDPGKPQEPRVYLRADQPWSPEEDQRMIELFTAGKTVSEVSEALQRKRSAIRSRLQKLETRS